MNGTDREISIREQQVEARRARIRELTPQRPMVRVTPRDDGIRKFIRHMPSGVGFPKEGPAEWPLDRFTKRRIADGDVTVEETGEQQQRSRRARSESPTE
jgi:hypothetical protein